MFNTILILLVILVVLWFCFSSKCQENFAQSGKCFNLKDANNRYGLTTTPFKSFDDLCKKARGKLEKCKWNSADVFKTGRYCKDYPDNIPRDVFN
jgi:cbb3-type cytochrome oxidase subunit 3